MTPKTLRSAAAAAALTAAGLAFTAPGPAWAAEPAAAAAPGEAAATAQGPLKPIASLDLPRYMGRWHEVARYPNRFQKQCAGAATADYALLPSGHVQVVNRCPRPDGTADEAIGEARRVGPEGSPMLQVRFAPAWLSFLPQVWGDYWVIELDEAYQLAVVSEPRRAFLWVLSRAPSLPQAQWTALEGRLRALGFDPARLLRSESGK